MGHSRHLSIRQALRTGWEALRARPIFWLIALFVYQLPQVGLQVGAELLERIEGAPPGWTIAGLLIAIGGLALTLLFNLGLTRMQLDAIDGSRPKIRQLFDAQGLFWRAVGISLALGLLISSLFLLLAPLLGKVGDGPAPLRLAGWAKGLVVLAVVLAGYLLVRFGWAFVALVDRRAGILHAFQTSYRITRGQTLRVVGLGIVLALISALTLLPLFLMGGYLLSTQQAGGTEAAALGSGVFVLAVIAITLPYLLLSAFNLLVLTAAYRQMAGPRNAEPEQAAVSSS